MADAVQLPLGRPFLRGVRAGVASVFVFVLFGTYIGIGALAHDLGFSILWLTLSTLLVWASPGQVILISALGGGAGPLEAAIAVSLSAVRLLPMVVALLPVLRVPGESRWRLVLPAHLTAISMWIEGLRLAPKVAREERIAFCTGLGCAMMTVALVSGVVGFTLAANMPIAFAAALLFLTPLSFLTSIARNARVFADRLALVLGLAIAPVLAFYGIGLDLLWTGLIGGTLAYAVHRLRGRAP